MTAPRRQPARGGGGIEVAYAQITADYNVAADPTKILAVPGLSITVPTSNRPIYVEIGGRGLKFSLATGLLAGIMDASVDPTLLQYLADFQADTAANNKRVPIACAYRIPPGTPARTYAAFVFVGIAGTITYMAAATSPGWIKATQA